MSKLLFTRAFKSKKVWLSLLVLISLGLVAVLAPWIAPYDPYRMESGGAYLPPKWDQAFSLSGIQGHILGTDRFGRDIFSRLIYGTRTAFSLAMVAVPLAALIGTLVGLAAGYLGGKFDTFVMLFTEMLQTLPGIMFMVIIVLIFRNNLTPTWFNGLITLVVGFAVVSWVSLARLVRINVLVLRSQLFIEAAISIGATPQRIIARHLLPNVAHVIMVWMINNIPAVILLEAILGYLGIGVTGAVDGGEFTVISWGGMFFSGRSALSRNPSMLVIPSLCILLISLSFLMLADYLNETTRQQ